jgi:Cd2+/Zn2+-exporting ATPase
MRLVAHHDGHDIAVGSQRLSDHLGVSFNTEVRDGIARLHAKGHTVVIVARDEEIAGLLALADLPRTSAKSMIKRLHALGGAARGGADG